MPKTSLSYKIILLLITAAFWPVMIWYIEGISKSFDQLCYILPLFILGAYVFTAEKKNESITKKHTFWLTIIIAVYALTYHKEFMSFRAGLMMLAIAYVISIIMLNKRISFGIYGLALLSLPVLPSIQFYFGYPLRYGISYFSCVFLRMSGFNVQQQGVSMVMGEQTLLVDAPCSGINMLWSGLLFYCILDVFLNIERKKSLLLMFATILIILFGNLIRSMALFFTEMEIIQSPDWMHTFIGSLSFVIVLLGIYFIFHTYGGVKKCKTLSFSS